MNNITVPVPDDRTAEFFQFFSLWLAGSLNLSASSGGANAESPKPPALNPWASTDQDFADAQDLWQKYSSRARAMFSLLIDKPAEEFTGEQIAQACDIPNGAHGVAGVLAWPGRHGAAIGRGLPTEWRWDAESLEGNYWIPSEVAEVFKAAREKVEGAA